MHTPDDDFADLRSAIRKICGGFPDSYWRARDEAHEFPWDFYTAMAEAAYHAADQAAPGATA